ncbi:MAG TPA: carboxypeptidase-like regulatory domain-containing protein [Thermoanaerobaculia bacterium]|nr:carboxypeptidase-like regulatory domain-containing protein [Thermoanaerobaculia bacterium]
MRYQTAGAVFLLLAFGSPVRGEPENPKALAARAVAERYYAGLSKTRDGKSDRPAQPTAMGLVVDLRGRPVDYARVVVECGAGEIHGEGRTGADGRFEIPYSNPEEKMGLTVTAPGFTRWAVVAVYEPHELVDYRVRLDREIGRHFLKALVAEPDPESRIWGLLEILGSRQFSYDIAEVFPFLGALRADLLAILESRAFTRPDDEPRPGSPDEQARELLAFWADPRDEPLVRDWKRARSVVLPASELSGEDLFGACTAWAAESCKSRTDTNPPPAFCDVKATDAEGTRALVNLSVRYAYWGSEEHLVFVREGKSWKLRLVVQGRISHWRPVEAEEGR